MAQPAPDFELARALMVDGQVRPNRVNDSRILHAMRTLPRERFVPPEQVPFAYIDEDLPLGGGRFLIKPMIIGRLLQLARPRAGENVLVVGAGTGYGAAILAACGAKVTALEEDDRLVAIGRQACAEFAPTVSFVSGPLSAGRAMFAPYDLVVIEGAVPAIPESIAAQVAREGGRLVTVIERPGTPGHAVLAEHSGTALRAQAEFDAMIPVLPSFVPAPAFIF
ncbi:MAG TPA: methyltransferase domain-containing protein [Acetobacteraceae bacterium]|nr:methyltransferase domain-containing protein [Acetobacteraceae bacterium]